MPAVTVENPLALPRLARPDSRDRALTRPVLQVVTPISRPKVRAFGSGGRSRESSRWKPPTRSSSSTRRVRRSTVPSRPTGAPWHPHRGIETVSYILDGEIAHHDSNGGGGVIREGDTQWMTAGAGILHDELPTERVYRQGGPVHGVQLWVNLPARIKFSHPDIRPSPAIRSDSSPPRTAVR